MMPRKKRSKERKKKKQEEENGGGEQTSTHGSLKTGLHSPHIARAVLSAIGLGSTNSQSIRGAMAAAEASSRSSISRANAPGIRLLATETTPAAETPSPWCRAAWASSSFPDQQRTPREA